MVNRFRVLRLLGGGVSLPRCNHCLALGVGSCLAIDAPEQIQNDADDVQVAGDRCEHLRPLDLYRHHLSRPPQLSFVHLVR